MLRRIVPLGALFAAALLSTVALVLLDARDDAWNQANNSTSNLARALERDLSAEMRSIDLALVAIKSILNDTTHGRISPELQRTLIQERVRSTRYLESVAVLDVNGEQIFDSRGEVPHGAPNLVDRDYFTVHRDRADVGFYVSRPFRSRRTNIWSLGFSRRLVYADGRFAGVVMGAVRLDQLEAAVFNGLQLGPSGALTLFRQDGIILARSPNEEPQLGRDLSGSPVVRRALEVPAGQYVTVAAVDGVRRLYAHRRLRDAPLMINVAMALDDIYAAWRMKALVIGSIAIALVAAAVGMALLLQRALARRRVMELAARESEAGFRLLSENSNDVVSRMDATGRRLYLSPASEKIFGRPVEELLARSTLDDVVPEDAPIVRDSLRRLAAGQREVMSTYRIARPDGAIAWLEASARAIIDERSSTVTGMVAVVRDITERKAAEDELASLARTDGLTGLANRRCFDEVLKKEWRRALRDRTSLSLLLLDIDHFKLFNDAFGHPAGDACLRQVAHEVQTAVRRPADLAARYGGEEIALLLPNTVGSGATAVAEQVRAAIESLGIAHSGLGGIDRVTVSVGVATAIPSADVGEESLLAAADAALYRAKRMGRNRVAVAFKTAAHGVADGWTPISNA
ncbi:sensor domain-containing diguanylate cyclase [Plastoroseomonas hellenica]|uniref:sensor domain-containing diguanylate cyclase n=1 Tax=Plastoroseomonas hellenica TaxID=2687306 RepID=UPI001BA5ED4E|nr:diguanylate cyclase [Plastoroseomonas hellenica]MBR0647740.1 diguanylate cyclase [Plastoroseomonas hellenica]